MRKNEGGKGEAFTSQNMLSGAFINLVIDAIQACDLYDVSDDDNENSFHYSLL